MARNIETYRSSVQQVAAQQGVENQDLTTANLAEMGKDIIRQGQEAKITENFSRAQLELNQINQQYQLDNEGNPFGGLNDLKEKRKEVFERYGSEISPFFKGAWNKNILDLEIKDDASTEVWAFAQTKKNTVRSINQTIKNNMSQATIDGQNFGTSDADEIGSMLNYSTSKAKLISYGDKNLGAGSTTDLLESYDDNYLKSFISGVSDSNPVKALRLMERDDVKKGFKDQGQYLKMKDAVETRALQADKIFTQREVLSALKDENNTLAKSMETNISYADLQKEFDRTNMSKSAQSFFLKANGFKDEKGENKLTNSEKMIEKVGLYDAIRSASEAEDIGPEQVSALQERVYSAMDRGVLNAEEGAEYINQFITPVIAGKEKNLSKFQLGKWNPLQDNIGYSGLDDLIDQVQIKPAEDEEELGVSTQNLNNERKLKIYNLYTDQLSQAASSRGIAIADIPGLATSERRKIYNDAQIQAKKLYLTEEYPDLSSLKDDQWPDSIVTPEGKKIKTGITSGKSSGVVAAPKPQYEFTSEEEMEEAGLKDGTPVMLNGVAGIYRK